MDLQGPVDIPALEAAIYDVVAHQEMLRLRMSSSTEAHLISDFKECSWMS